MDRNIAQCVVFARKEFDAIAVRHVVARQLHRRSDEHPFYIAAFQDRTNSYPAAGYALPGKARA
jgi:hypothetical protein